MEYIAADNSLVPDQIQEVFQRVRNNADYMPVRQMKVHVCRHAGTHQNMTVLVCMSAVGAPCYHNVYTHTHAHAHTNERTHTHTLTHTHTHTHTPSPPHMHACNVAPAHTHTRRMI